MTKELLDRINALARKSREMGLTPEEAEEQKKLRQEYLTAFRGRMEQQLQSITIVDGEGNRRELKKKQSEE